MRRPGHLARLSKRTTARHRMRSVPFLISSSRMPTLRTSRCTGERAALSVPGGLRSPGPARSPRSIASISVRISSRELEAFDISWPSGSKNANEGEQEQQPVALLVSALDDDLGFRRQVLQDPHGGQAGWDAGAEVDVHQREVERLALRLAQRFREAARVADPDEGMRRALDDLGEGEARPGRNRRPRGCCARVHRLPGADFHRARTRVQVPAAGLRQSLGHDRAVVPVQMLVEDPQAGPGPGERRLEPGCRGRRRPPTR